MSIHDSIFEHEINIFFIKEIYLTGGSRPTYLFIPLGFFIIRTTRYYFLLLSVNLLSVKLSLTLDMNIVQKLLSTAFPSLFIITCKVSSSFFNLALNTLFFVNFSSYEFLTYQFTVEERSLYCIFQSTMFNVFCNYMNLLLLGLKSKSPLINKALL